jgi:RNA polymerase sigma-70 factor (ECF subfamily)
LSAAPREWKDDDGARGVEPSDEVLCQKVARRDEKAFEALVERHQERAYRLAWSILGDAEEAKDLSQEAFLRLYERAGRFDGRSRFATWFHRLLVNLCLDRRRQRQTWLRRLLPSKPGEDDDPIEAVAAPVGDPAEQFGNREAASRIWKAAGRLSVQQRAALALHVREDLSAKEIAKILDCSEGTARVHLHRALKTLREVMKHE